MMTKTLVACPEEPEPERTNSTGTSNSSVTFTGITSVVYDCSASGHVLTEHTIETVEGDLTGYCELCSQVFRMKRMPGGVTAVRVRALISALAEEKWKDVTAVLLEHAYIKKAMAEDEVSLNECRGLMDIASAMIRQRLLGDDPHDS